MNDNQFMAGFGALVNALDRGKGPGGDINAMFPKSDADDMANRARFIPGQVTMARRAGKKVTFVQKCTPNCWYWVLPDGSHYYHFDPMTYDEIGAANGRKKEGKGLSSTFKGGAGPCPHCGNTHTGGGMVKP